MKVSFKFLGFLFLLSACGQREVLVDNKWILIGGTVQGKQIEFKSTDRIVFTDPNGKVVRSLNLGKDETIILPGIRYLNAYVSFYS